MTFKLVLARCEASSIISPGPHKNIVDDIGSLPASILDSNTVNIQSTVPVPVLNVKRGPRTCPEQSKQENLGK